MRDELRAVLVMVARQAGFWFMKAWDFHIGELMMEKATYE